jgi:hypothetical protein
MRAGGSSDLRLAAPGILLTAGPRTALVRPPLAGVITAPGVALALAAVPPLATVLLGMPSSLHVEDG